MALPKIAKVTHELVIPSTGKKIKYRPFLVKEEKVLVLAQESGSQDEMIRALKDVISACVQTRGFKVDDLATFDIEYVFLQIRGSSVGADVEVLITCPDDGETQVPVTIYLDEVSVIIDDEHTNTIKLDDEYSVKMKYPSVDMAMGADVDNIGVEQSLELIASCIDMIYTDDESWSSSDSTVKELTSWVEELDPKQFKKIEHFFETMPKLSHTVKVLNPETNVESEILLEGLGSFFA